MSEFGAFSPRPFPLWWPTRRAWKERLAELDGSIPKLAAEILGRAGIQMSVRQNGEVLPADHYPWNNSDRGTLFVGCHRGGNEPAFLAALLGESGDKPLRAFGKPYAFLSQGIAELAQRLDGTTDERVANTLLPLVSRKLAGDTGPAVSTQRLFWWMGMRERLPKLAEIEANTDRVFSVASHALQRGESMLIFPTGRIADATTAPWRPGVGRLVAEYADFADQVDIHLAPTYIAGELIESVESAGGHLGNLALTAEIHRRYVEHFNEPC